MKKIALSSFAEAATHVLVWLLVFTSPLLFYRGESGIDIYTYLRGAIFPMSLFVIFYTYYFLLVPRMFMCGKKRDFFITGLILVAVMALIINELTPIFAHLSPHLQKPNLRMPPRWLFVARDTATMLLAAGFALTLRLSNEWRKAEEARKEAEIGRREAELKNLRNQVNPHFLLNTLNNIYALTAFDSQRAQNAIRELSRLLRCILYETPEEFTPLCKEADFLKSYINLMRIRIPAHVNLEVDLHEADNCTLPIAPLIFISIVENAFKHGISPTDKCFIRISLKANTADGTIDFTCSNSNFPKSRSDLSGNGIGLKGIASRLQLIYPGRYVWEKGTDDSDTIYTSHLTINTRNK